MWDGHKITYYFHHKASQWRSRNHIQKLQDKEGEWRSKEEEEEVEKVIVDYFTEIFSSSMPSDYEASFCGQRCTSVRTYRGGDS